MRNDRAERIRQIQELKYFIKLKRSKSYAG